MTEQTLWPAPSNEDEFQALMEDVDRFLRAREVPLHARELAGISEVSKRLSVPQWPMHARHRRPAAGVYEGLDLTARVIKWFADRYGDRLRSFDPRPGRVAVMLKSDIWVIHLPLIVGHHEVIASRDIRSTSGPVTDPRVIPVCNIVESLEGITPSMQASLSDSELAYLMTAFRVGMAAYLLARSLRDQSLINEAISDHEATVTFLAGHERHAGQAKWAAQQAAEKVLKAGIVLFGGAAPKIHDLTKLGGTFAQLSSTTVDPALLRSAHASPSVRYGEGTQNPEPAVAAHHAALEVTRVVAVAMRTRLGRRGLDWSSVRPSY